MRIFLKNKIFRLNVIGTFISHIGQYLFNTVFIVYAANVYKSELAVSIASFIAMFPLVFDLILGILADSTKNKKKYIYMIAWIQGHLFVGAYFIIGHNSLLSFATLTFINLISDLMGMYAGNLEYSYFNKIVPQEDIREASLFGSVVYRLKAIIGPTLGVVLLKVSNNNYQIITLINALAFMIYAVIARRVYRNLEDPKVLEKESLETKFKETIKNVISIYKEKEEDTKEAVTLLLTESFNGSMGTAINNMLVISFVANPIFNIPFEDINLFISLSISIIAILSGLFANDIFSKWSIRKLFWWQLIPKAIYVILFALNTDISRLIGWIIFLISFYIGVKTGPQLKSSLFEKVDEGRIASVTSGWSFITTASIPLVTGLMLFIYNINIYLAWGIAILTTFVNIIIYKKNVKILN